MNNNIDEIKNKIISEFNMLKTLNIILLVVVIVLVILIIVLFVVHKLKIHHFLIFESLMTILLVFASISFNRFVLDEKNIKNDNFSIIHTKVVDYAYGYLDGSDKYVKGNPIFEDENGKKYRFACGPTEIYHSYIVIFLPNTKIALILEELL
jgi:hypothetical protein